jgi:protein involved in polysaccharide export with SLBB domain
MNARTLVLSLVVLGAGLAGRVSQAQNTDSIGNRLLASRAELKQAQSRFAAAGMSDAAARINLRLTEGDFQPGDHILLAVTAETTLTDTFVVAPDRSLHLPPPVSGDVSLRGILRSELEPHLTSFISRYVRGPVVRANPLVRLSVQGEVAHAGFYGVPANGLLSDALMAAGGTTQNANLKKLKVERAGETILEDDGVRRALASSLTLDQLGLRNGDEISIGRKRGGTMVDGLRVTALIVSTAVGIYTLSRVVK